ncbi:cytochrome P450 [Nocardia transvalensis]|uniref:cytochrome P450 n=1 Tax=Nocardia transvalensis TaxID=37333 RepID=UPI00189494E5|nr:cytochrome P450 [Nocardia transvalensis]MBF6333220.1 cytochrome P450 [Nocardia transvalensis]
MTSAPSPAVTLPHPENRNAVTFDRGAMEPDRPTQREYELSRELGPIYEVRFAEQFRMIVITGTELAQEVWDESRFEKHVAEGTLKMLRDITGDALFMAHTHEPHWGMAHRILTPGFTKEAMALYHPAMVDSIETMFAYWDGKPSSTPRVNLTQDLNSLTFELIGRAGFSTSFGAFEHGEELHPFLTQLNRAMWWISKSSNASSLTERVRATREHGPQYKEDLAALREFGLALVAKRAAEPRQGPKDLLDLMLTNADPETGEKLPEDNIAYQVVSFLLAGQETTAGTLGFAFHYLMQQPDIADKVRAEVRDVVGEHERISFEQVGKLRYTRAVIDETLRLWPSAPGYFRAARVDTELGGRWPVAAGEPIFVLSLGLQRNDDWPDALIFDPDRFLPGAPPKGPYRPFGTGARACIGRQFALHEAVLSLAMATRRYDFGPDADYTLAVHEQITIRPSGLHATLQRRTT